MPKDNLILQDDLDYEKMMLIIKKHVIYHSYFCYIIYK